MNARIKLFPSMTLRLSVVMAVVVGSLCFAYATEPSLDTFTDKK